MRKSGWWLALLWVGTLAVLSRTGAGARYRPTSGATAVYYEALGVIPDLVQRESELRASTGHFVAAKDSAEFADLLHFDLEGSNPRWDWAVYLRPTGGYLIVADGRAGTAAAGTRVTVQREEMRVTVWRIHRPNGTDIVIPYPDASTCDRAAEALAILAVGEQAFYQKQACYTDCAGDDFYAAIQIQSEFMDPFWSYSISNASSQGYVARAIGRRATPAEGMEIWLQVSRSAERRWTFYCDPVPVMRAQAQENRKEFWSAEAKGGLGAAQTAEQAYWMRHGTFVAPQDSAAIETVLHLDWSDPYVHFSLKFLEASKDGYTVEARGRKGTVARGIVVRMRHRGGIPGVTEIED